MARHDSFKVSKVIRSTAIALLSLAGILNSSLLLPQPGIVWAQKPVKLSLIVQNPSKAKMAQTRLLMRGEEIQIPDFVAEELSKQVFSIAEIETG
jgi:hypothetical protein